MADKPGCPKCGSTLIQVMVDCVANVTISWDGNHMDNVEWGVASDVDIIEADHVTCQACGWSTPVDGDLELFDLLGLETS